MQLPTIQDLEILLYFLFGDPKIYIVTTIAAPKQTVITQIKPAGEQKKEKKMKKSKQQHNSSLQELQVSVVLHM